MEKIKFDFTDADKEKKHPINRVLTDKIEKIVKKQVKHRLKYRLDRRYGDVIISLYVTEKGIWIALVIKVNGVYRIVKIKKMSGTIVSGEVEMELEDTVKCVIYDTYRRGKIVM